MPVYHTQPEFTLLRSECVEAMKAIPDNSIDSIVTDPPYGIRFMGKAWDGANIEATHKATQETGGHRGISLEAGRYNRATPANLAFQQWTQSWAREAFRILKPGGHLVSFASTRTYHRMAAGVEDAGFEIRDQLAWVFGSGFPKSLDVSKAIDASDKIGTVRVRSLRFTEFMRSTGVTARQINDATDSSMASHYLTAKEQPEVATEAMFSKLRPMIAARGVEIPADIEELVAWRTVESENMKRRTIIRTEKMVDLSKTRPVSIAAQGIDSQPHRDVNVTAAHTEDAKKWEGWGTALKPAWEPIVLARKPLIGTVADNVLEHGTGALNIGGCRIKAVIDEDGHPHELAGRWPANLCHDASPEVVEHFPNESDELGGPGSAARFFYAAKASTEDRDEGLESLPVVAAHDLVERSEDSPGLDSPRAGAGRTSNGRRNIHPTVKPTELMRWLVRLITPPRRPLPRSVQRLGLDGQGVRARGRQVHRDRHRRGGDLPANRPGPDPLRARAPRSLGGDARRPGARA